MPLFLLGFTKETFGQYLIFGAILTLFNHANTSLRVPILRWIIATPEFHHWHHSKEQVAHNKNFSGFPLIDLLFGTFYLPQSKMPSNYGVDEFIPQTYGEQILYPIKIKKDVRIQILKLLKLPIIKISRWFQENIYRFQLWILPVPIIWKLFFLEYLLFPLACLH